MENLPDLSDKDKIVIGTGLGGSVVAGAAIGSIVPVAGTIVGAAVGAVVGGIGALVGVAVKKKMEDG